MHHIDEELKEAQEARNNRVIWGAVGGAVIGLLIGVDILLATLGALAGGALLFSLTSGKVNNLRRIQEKEQ